MENALVTSPALWSQPGIALTSVESAVVHCGEGVAPGDGSSYGSAIFTDWRSLLRAAPPRCF